MPRVVEREAIFSKCFCIKYIRSGVSNRALLALQKYQDMLQCGAYVEILRLSRNSNTI
jgi:hypothetical protein